MNKPKGDDCIDCGRSTYSIKEYYMVHDWVWMSAGMSPEGGMLCIRDLERRLRRKLTFRDFLWCPLNVRNLRQGHGSKMLQNRLEKRNFDMLELIKEETIYEN